MAFEVLWREMTVAEHDRRCSIRGYHVYKDKLTLPNIFVSAPLLVCCLTCNLRNFPVSISNSPGWNISGQRTVSIRKTVARLEILSQRHDRYFYFHITPYSRRQYKVSVPLKKTRCPTAYQR